MNQTMARAAQGDKVFGIVAASFYPRFDVMHFQELHMLTTRRPATVPIAGEDLSSGGWWDGGGVAFPFFVHPAVALGSFHNIFTDWKFTLAGRDRGFAAIRTLMDVDLKWGA